MSEIGDFEYSELWIKLAKVEAENERLRALLKRALNFIPPTGQWDAVSKIREEIIQARDGE